MRSEPWLRRSFQRIVLATMAGTAGCHGGASDREDGGGDHDAATGPRDASIRDGSGGGDATTASGAEAGDATCSSPQIDGASIQETQPDGCTVYPVFHALSCGPPPASALEGCFVNLDTCVPICHDSPDAAPFLYCQLAPVSCDDAGNVLDAEAIVECVFCNGITGRRPLGLAELQPADGSPLGRYFASMAHLESASVRAFRDLEAWLALHRAPRRLRIAARRSAADERRHAGAAARLALRFGGKVSRPEVRAVRLPSVLELVEDDAVEGCVKETFGALLATWQAAHAGDARLRRTLRGIAADETRHAALAWDVLAWGAEKLDRAGRRRVARAMAHALADVERTADSPVHASIRLVAGYPPPVVARALSRALRKTLRPRARILMRGTRERPSPAQRLG